MQRYILAAILAFASTASAENIIQGRQGYHMAPVQGIPIGSAADTHILFLNKCTGNCTVRPGNTDNRSSVSDIANSTVTLTQFSQSDAVWGQVMSCMRNTFSRFNVTITDIDPGQTPHMEVMVAGVATELLGSQGQGVGGIADFPCGQIGSCDAFMPNALVFAFANDPYYNGDPDNICSTAAQEIAHTWALDHVVDATDPMTYNNFSGIRQYKDGQKCGSDCQGGQSPFGLTCSGSGGQATHACAMNNAATQDEVSTILTLFGSSTPDTTPPVVMITSPSNGATVMPGFTVTANVTDDIAVVSAELKLDGTSIKVLGGAPFTWTTPSTLNPGNHHIEVIGTDGGGNTTTAAIDVGYGAACTKASDCSDSTQICDNGHCVAGPSSPGGLGSPCNANSDCASNQCGDDGTGSKYCVETCDPTNSKCPSGFSCASTGAGGVCWPAADGGGSGGCESSNGGGPLFMFGALGIALAFRRRRR
jgi:uncharacterized protein (TIGR03382 family)